MKFQADISYMVCDCKYNKKDGLKICEVQHGTISALTGDIYNSQPEKYGTIMPKIVSFFNQYPLKKWATSLSYPPLVKILSENGWEIHQSFDKISKIDSFIECAKVYPENPSSILSYKGLVYCTSDMLNNLNPNLYPGILFIDGATIPYWVDKYKMNSLFDKNNDLKQYKADWMLCSRTYDPSLIINIYEKMPAEYYVIKPRKQFLGNGIIIVESINLDKTIKMISQFDENLKKHPDHNYRYWSINKDTTFIIEKYYPSEYLKILDESNNNLVHTYDATIRIAFILKYDLGNIYYYGLGGYWKLPSKPLEEDVSLNKKMISFCEIPFYKKINSDLLDEINIEVEKAMKLLYKIMLNIDE